MTALRQYFEENPEIFAALVAAIAILGGLLGSIVGAKIQANGGRDQAAAAREAAAATNEAQRVAALWTVRRVQVAEFVQLADEVMTAARIEFNGRGDEGLRDRGDDAIRAMSMRESEIRLIAPTKVVDATKAVSVAVAMIWVSAVANGEIKRAGRALRDLADGPDPEVRDAARAATSVLDDEGSTEADRTQALSAVRGLSPQQVRYLSGPPIPYGGPHAPRRSQVDRDYREKMKALVAAAREMLRSEDDVAPAAPVQRRRWWRAA